MGRRVALEIHVECSTSSTDGSGNQQDIGSIEAPIGSRIEQEQQQEELGQEERSHSSWTSRPGRTSPATRRTTGASPPPRRKTTFCLVVRYVAASTLAVALSVVCPGGTDLWWCHDDDPPHPPNADNKGGGAARRRTGDTNHDCELWWGILVPILLSLAVTQFLFILVVKSDPGYLDPEMMDRLNTRCGIAATAAHDETSFSPSDENNEQEEFSTLLPASASSRDGDEASNGRKTKPDEGSSTGQRSSPPNPRRRPYCSTCRLAPPLRAHHCRDCQRCVATFDHHCPLIGNCVGERNRALFVAFLIAQAVGIVLCARVVLSSTVGLATIVFGGNDIHHPTALPALQVFVTELYVVPIAATAFAMATAHVVMVTCNISTFELAKGHRLEYMPPYDITDCPFSSGAGANIRRAVRLGWNDPWLPHEWSLPTSSPSTVNADWWNHLWRNKYWSCC